MPTKTWSSVRGRRARVTKVDSVGTPVANTCASVVTEGFITVNYSPEVEEGAQILVRNAGGGICVSEKSCDALTRVAIEIEFCNVNPEILTLMTGSPLVLDSAGTSVGNRIKEGSNCDTNFALEVWSDVPAVTPASYGYFVTPNVQGGVIQEFSLENDAATFTVSSSTKDGSGWGRGPYDDVDETSTPGVYSALVTKFQAGEHMDMHLTTAPPPAVTAACEAITAAQVTASQAA